MNSRIQKLTQLTLDGQMYAHPTKTPYEDSDFLLPRQPREVKQLCRYIQNQKPVLTEFSKMTGFFNCDNSVVGDAFRRSGHAAFAELFREAYCKPLENLSTFEWQHATADYQKLLSKGLRGIIREIEESMALHQEAEQLAFLQGLKDVAEALIAWAEKCAACALALAEAAETPEYKENLTALAGALQNVPANPPASFYEAVLSIYICFSADPDSLGTLDRYLQPFYDRDLAAGVLTRECAKEYLQELFLMLQAATKKESRNFTRGGESHFCIGGYLPDGSDGFSDLSRLIVESMLELPIWIPQVTLRWTEKTPREVFRFMLDCERKDPNKRIAFQNDEKRIRCYREICGFSFQEAVRYTTVGCNEPAFLGTVSGATSHVNFAHCIETLFHSQSHRIRNISRFEEFYSIFLDVLFSDLEAAFACDDKFNLLRARDTNYLSSLFFQGCISKAKSLTQGAGDTVIASPPMTGIPNVIDSLIIVKQFVFDEKLLTMEQLIAALQANWEGYEDLRTLIRNRGDFFGNDTDRSNAVAQKLYDSLYHFLKGKRNVFGYQWLLGDLIGYNIHHKWFGEKMEATPDGRRRGDPLKFGLGQSEGKDRNGLSALLNSIAAIDPSGIGCGSTITNIMLDAQLINNDAHFEKTVDLLENYFKNGGVHFQLTYVSREDLLRARETPEDYKNLRVRVSGFSDYFVRLHEDLQEDIIERTQQK